MDFIRQIELLDPKQIENKSITLVGAGATGSYVALQLAQLGWGDSVRGQGVLKVFDADVIEEHNLCNQAYEIAQIGKPKVEALQELIKRKCGFDIEVYNEMVTEETDPALVQSNYVFILTDTMSSRKEIFDKFLRFSFKTDLVIETRLGLRDGRIYAFSPHSSDQRDEWEKTLYSDEEAETSACGASSSIVPSVVFLASLAVQRVLHHFDAEHGNENLKRMGSKNPFWNEIQYSLFPESFYLKQFGEKEVPIMTT